MDKLCERLEICGFFIKYSQIMDKTCKGFIKDYCKGPKGKECKRKVYFDEKGEAPGDDMMPV